MVENEKQTVRFFSFPADTAFFFFVLSLDPSLLVENKRSPRILQQKQPSPTSRRSRPCASSPSSSPSGKGFFLFR